MLRLTVLLTAITICGSYAMAQIVVNSPYSKGIRLIAADSSFATKMNVRIQQRYDGSMVEGSDQYTDLMQVRRARLKFDGWAYNPKYGYKMEFDLVSGNVLDAILKWKINKNTELWFGQTKLPGNIERVISSQKLQFVDRSLLNSQYNIDRDKGVWLRHNLMLGNMPVRTIAAITQGEGRNFKSTSTGHDYTGRIEFWPLGKFTGKGDYFAADLKRESTPKLIMGVTYDYNEGAVRESGQRGDELTESRNISSLFADMHFKYNGWSVMCEYVNRETDKTPAIYDETTGDFVGTFNIGSALNCQTGYMFKDNWEIAGRYTAIDHASETKLTDITEFTLGLSHYILDHKLKAQTDISLNQRDGLADRYIFRLQVEIGL